MLTDLVTNPLHVKLEDKYALSEKLLGKGASARVFEGIRKDTNEKVAIKKITKGMIDYLLLRSCCIPHGILGAVEGKRLKQEVSILKKLKHVNIMELHDFFEEPFHFVVVTELIEGGDLLSRLRNRKNYSEKVARDLFVILALTVQFIHEHDVVHRDLKVSSLYS